MTKMLIVLVVVLFSSQSALGDQELPVLHANSNAVDIQDGTRLWKGVWIADPTVALDLYAAAASTTDRVITFMTDIDSMSFDVQPGRTYDFIILLNGQDACRTRISTMNQGYTRIGADLRTGPDTIPITISHGKLHLNGKINDSEPLDLIFDTGADTNAVYPSAMRKGVRLGFDGTVTNAGTGGTTKRRSSSDNRLEVAGLRWEHEPVLSIEKQADFADGIVGYRVFEHKVVEIDYDRMVMVIHDEVPVHAAGFAKTPMPFVGSLTGVEVGLNATGERSIGVFVLDTAGTGSMLVNQAFATAHGLRDSMTKLRTSRSSGVGPATIRNDVLVAQELTLGGFALTNVPIHVEQNSDTNAAPPGGVICMEVLKRFNTILDYPHNEAYFKPNTLFAAPFRAGSSSPFSLAVIGGVGVVVVSATVLAVHRTRSQRRTSRTSLR